MVSFFTHWYSCLLVRVTIGLSCFVDELNIFVRGVY